VSPKKNLKLISKCPFCDGELCVSGLSCNHCNTRMESKVPIPSFFLLPPELQEFALLFLRCRGNIKDVEKELNISYPSVCKRLDLVNEILGHQTDTPLKTKVLDQLEKGEITAKEAIQLLKGK
jgi:hypothetical protein